MSRHDGTYEAMVIGGGPAGLAAALTLGRVRRRTLLLDSGEYRNANAAHMQNVITRDGTPPAEFRQIARDQLAHYSSIELRDIEAYRAASDDGRFAVELADGTVEQARRLLLATGLVDELPAIPGLDAIWGRSALHCPFCHGYEVRDTPLAVLGAGPAPVRLALQLTRFTPDIALCSNGSPELDPETRALLESHGVAVRDEPVTRVESTDGYLERIFFASGAPLPRRALFTHATPRQRSALPEQLGCTRFEDGMVEINDFGMTSVAGVFAAGDMARRAGMPTIAAVVPAAASGVVAAAAIEHDLLAADFGIASPTARP